MIGGGNGELCKLLVKKFSKAQIWCYEPSEKRREEAKYNLENLPEIKIIADVGELPTSYFDLIFCLEVFEHLPPQETEAAIIDNISKILKPKGYVCIGIPNEIYIPALIKGLFRMTRRYGAYDANLANLISATLGNPPKNRPIYKEEKLFLHYHHMGFDFREFYKNISAKLDIEKMWGSPVIGIPIILNFEVYFLCKHKA